MLSLYAPDAIDILLLYPRESLCRQLCRAVEQGSRWRLETSHEQSLPKMRRLLRRANAALVDATEDPSRATDAFLQSIARLGRDAVAVYTEAAHEELEIFVRQHGALFFLGPMPDEDWVKQFERIPIRTVALPVGPTPEWHRRRAG